MKIVTERLILRTKGNIKVKDSDINDIVEGIGKLNVSKWLLVVPYPYAKKDAKSWLKRKKKNTISFLIELKVEKKVIGTLGLQKIDKFQETAEIGYWINEKYHRRGYGSEAVDAALKFAFEKLKLRRIYAGILAGNPSSGKLLEKFGAKYEGTSRQSKRCKADGKIKDEILYGLLKEDWIKATKKKK